MHLIQGARAVWLIQGDTPEVRSGAFNHVKRHTPDVMRVICARSRSLKPIVYNLLECSVELPSLHE